MSIQDEKQINGWVKCNG